VDGKRAAAVRAQLALAEGGELGGRPFIVPAEAIERLTARELESALNRLPTEQREAVLLCDMWGFRYDEIAEIVGSPVGTVRSRIARARSRLSEFLGRAVREAEDRSRP
jgi:RNA polymerase sigma-70 factor (ECF subfamily)